MADANPKCPVCGTPMIWCGIGPGAEAFCKHEDAHKYDFAQREPAWSGQTVDTSRWGITFSIAPAASVVGGFQPGSAPPLGTSYAVYKRPAGQAYPPGSTVVGSNEFIMPDGSSPGPEYPCVGGRII